MKTINFKLFRVLLRAGIYKNKIRYADLSHANLYNADLSRADLSGADLSRANLSGADLSGADLSCANLSRANLSGADLCCADLSCANLSRADLSGANLSCANLSRANFNESTAFMSLSCPEVGSFTAFKKAKQKIVVLRITENAKRSSATSYKCRCSEAEVLRIENLDSTLSEFTEISSDHDNEFIYKVGRIVKVNDFDENRWSECSTGIHFFMSRELAVKY